MINPADFYSEDELDNIFALIHMSVEDDTIFPNWEFHLLTDASLAEAKYVLEHWPNIDLCEESNHFAVRGILLNVWGYPHKQWDLILERTGLEKSDVLALKHKFDEHVPKNV